MPTKEEWRNFHYGTKPSKPPYHKPIWSLYYNGGRAIVRNRTYGYCKRAQNNLLKKGGYIESSFNITKSV